MIKPIDQSTIRKQNVRMILDLLSDTPEMTRNELAEKAGLKNGTPPTRCRIFVLIAALLILASVVWTILDPEDGAFAMLFAFLGAAVMLGVVLGIKAAQIDFRRQNKAQ
jgi:hypothetical protein